jgi:hypothetical protein
VSGVRHMNAVPVVRRSTTQLVLWRLLRYMLVATAVVLGTTLWSYQRVHSAADAVRTRTVPAILALVQARDAVAKADSAAITSFLADEAPLAGPGQEYRNQLAIASQSLNQVAEDNAAGEPGSRTLQLVEGMLVVYTELVGQADVEYRQPGGTTLGITDLWSASRLLHNEDGVLAQLDALLSLESRTFDEQLAASSTTWLVVLVSVGPIVALLVLLGLTHTFVRRRFRRVVNPLLLLSSLALVGLSLFIWLVFDLRDQLTASRTTMTRIVDGWSAQLSVTNAEGKTHIGQLMQNLCGKPPSGCGGTVDAFLADAAQPASAGPAASGQPTFDPQTLGRAALAEAGSELWIYALTVAIAGAVLLGLLPRISEYRYRPT